jgi:hypothetical protein
MAKQISAKEVIDSNKTFYAKKWQQNGYYLIEKFVYHEENDCYELFVQKTSGWYSWGIAYEKPFTCNDGKVITNKSWWLYIFEHNSFKFSFEEMKDNKNYNLD